MNKPRIYRNKYGWWVFKPVESPLFCSVDESVKHSIMNVEAGCFVDKLNQVIRTDRKR